MRDNYTPFRGLSVRRAFSGSLGADQHDYSPFRVENVDALILTLTTSIRITGLVNGYEGRMMTICNSLTSDGLLLIEGQSTASTDLNRFALLYPIFLHPGEHATFLYVGSGASGRWLYYSGTHGTNLVEQFDAFDDFYGLSTSSSGLFALSTSGTGASGQTSTYLVNATEKPIGVLQIDTGTTATGRVYVGGVAQQGIVPAQGPALFLTRLAVEALSTSTERFQIRAGFHDGAAGIDVTDGVYWEYDDAAAAVWRRASSAASIRNKNDVTGLTVDTNYIWLGIFVNSEWTRADFFYSTDSLLFPFGGSQSTNMPNSSQLLTVSVGINKTVGTTQRNLSIDLFGSQFSHRRG